MDQNEDKCLRIIPVPSVPARRNDTIASNEFKRDLSDPAIPYEESTQPASTNAVRDFLAGVLCTLAVGIPLTVVYLWRTGGL